MFSPHDFTVLASPQTAAWSCVRLGLVWTRSLRPRLPSARPRPPLSPFPRRVIRATWSNTANGASACAAPCVCTRRARPPPRRPDGGNAASPSAQEPPAALVVATAPRPPPSHAQPRGSVLPVLRFQRWIRHAACAPCAVPSARQRPPRERVSIARSSADGHPVCFWFGTIKKKAQW